MPERTKLESSEREHAAAVARDRFESATAALSNERRFGGPDIPWTETEIMDHARKLVAEARARR